MEPGRPAQQTDSEDPEAIRLRSPPHIAVMQSTEDRLGVDQPKARHLDRSRLRAILVESQVSPTTVVVAQVLLEHSLEMPLIENDHMVQAFSPNRPDHPLDIRVLPGRSFCCPNLLDAQS